MNVITLNAIRDRDFLSEQRKDPVTQQLLKAGDRIVICARQKIAFLEDTWGGQCPLCECRNTLDYLPVRGRVHPPNPDPDPDEVKRALYINSKKSLFITYIWWLLFGLFFHRVYLKRYSIFCINILLFSLAVLSESDTIASVWLIFGGVIYFLDLFLIPQMVKQYNLELANRLGLTRLPN
ncbi:MAG: hypothetical protein KGV46_02815 [Pasteurella sp.]|nr:hypothetical protein [Pasteurella sp.]